MACELLASRHVWHGPHDLCHGDPRIPQGFSARWCEKVWGRNASVECHRLRLSRLSPSVSSYAEGEWAAFRCFWKIRSQDKSNFTDELQESSESSQDTMQMLQTESCVKFSCRLFLSFLRGLEAQNFLVNPLMPSWDPYGWQPQLGRGLAVALASYLLHRHLWIYGSRWRSYALALRSFAEKSAFKVYESLCPALADRIGGYER